METSVVTQPRRENGFATVACIAVCAGLATVALALIELAFSAERRALQAVDRATQEQAAKSAIALSIADLVNSPAKALSISSHEVGQWSVEVVATNEQAKANILLWNVDQLTPAAKQLGDAAIAERIVVEREAVPSLKTLSLADALAEIGVPSEARACADDWFTVYSSSVDPLASGEPAALDGGIINLRARVSTPPSDTVREEIVLITGDPTTPILKLSEKWFRLSDKKGCEDAGA